MGCGRRAEEAQRLQGVDKPSLRKIASKLCRIIALCRRNRSRHKSRPKLKPEIIFPPTTSRNSCSPRSRRRRRRPPSTAWLGEKLTLRRASSPFPNARGHPNASPRASRFESAQLHQDVGASRPGFPAPTIPNAGPSAGRSGRRPAWRGPRRR